MNKRVLPMGSALSLLGLLGVACAEARPRQNLDERMAVGHISAVQAATSDTETFINLLVPKNRDYILTAKDPKGNPASLRAVATVESPPSLWKIIKTHVTGLRPGVNYQLFVHNSKSAEPMDIRSFRTLNVKATESRFVLGSCVSDSPTFTHVREPMWDMIFKDEPDFILLAGDLVYVDSFDFVPREKASAFDIWQRYVDSVRATPLFNRERLIPLLATWDDHDYGTNDGDKNFASKEAALRTFRAFFMGGEIPGVFKPTGLGVSSEFNGFGQKFILTDGRYYRQTDGSPHPNAHFGKEQSHWILESLKSPGQPTWLVSGSQVFADPFFAERDGERKQLNESIKADSPGQFKTLLESLQASPRPVGFLSGDIHMSETNSVPELDSIEITSSPIHSFIFRRNPEFWPNPRRRQAVKDHNYLLLETQASPMDLKIEIQSKGVKSASPYFRDSFRLKKSSLKKGL